MGTRRSEGLVAASIVLVLIIADVKMFQIYSYSMSKPAVFSLLLCVISSTANCQGQIAAIVSSKSIHISGVGKSHSSGCHQR